MISDVRVALRRPWHIGLLAGIAVLGCREKLTSPAECPTLCPGEFEIRDTTLVALTGQDSSYIGYVVAGQGPGLRTSNQLPAGNDRAVIRYNPRPDSVLVGDTLRAYSIDSVAIELSIIDRDTSVHGLKVFLYREAATVDSAVTFASVSATQVPANLIDSVLVDDTASAPRLRLVYSGSTLSKVDIPPADSGRLAYSVAISAPAATGVLVGSVSAGSSTPILITYVHAAIPDTTLQRRTITTGVGFNTFVTEAPPVFDPDLLTIGGVPSARSIIRFQFPDALKDSAQIIRATLELTPTTPVAGVPNDTALVEVREVLADFGAKSPVSTATSRISEYRLATAFTDTVRVEVVQQVRDWQTSLDVPNALAVALTPAQEASSFTRATFGSTRSALPPPRLRITYAKRFPFERP